MFSEMLIRNFMIQSVTFHESVILYPKL